MRSSLALLVMLTSTGAAQNAAPDSATDEALEALIAAGMEAAATLKAEAAAIDPAIRAMLAPAVVGWIASTRKLAVERGVEGIPPDIRSALGDFVPETVLDRVRWRVDDNLLSVQQGLFRMAYISAITLDDVVLFATADDAADPALWAHEIFHVIQYADWGVAGFVDRYLADFESVEQEAWDFRWRWREAAAGASTARDELGASAD